ncbi:sigma factor-like helix-turn-helix DNA-binding protein [Amycolatopsis thermophila]|uniref:RNA polymerase sigma-70 factor (ECF subfamily) n=1 Tax=Amycolatopsis thermophila TaxID=206084 RepID=A0ABU0ELK8_9PSEU|nr:sigma factor-like helix-turn-helix DNA-binding protein [Amycolatopsis thermophila]MDQ0376112.1 RNA polymerase sigma-70 factor (ECF subfamily) [Amycolatopsis thermophila]
MTVPTAATVFPGADVVASAAAGDAAAIRELVAAITPVVVRYCRARLGPGADDVAQEACLAVLHALPRWEGPLAALVYRTVSAKVDAAGWVPEVISPVTALPAGEREVVVLRVAAGLSAEDTASALTMSTAAVRLRQHRALNRLRRGPR